MMLGDAVAAPRRLDEVGSRGAAALARRAAGRVRFSSTTSAVKMTRFTTSSNASFNVGKALPPIPGIDEIGAEVAAARLPGVAERHRPFARR